MPILDFRPDGYLPEGLHPASEGEVEERFGRATPRRRRLVSRVKAWLRLARVIGAHRFFVNGSFVTAKPEPGDVDCVCWLPDDFEQQYYSGRLAAVELYEMLVTRRPEELFGVFTLARWNAWVEFFSRTREPDGRRKGIVEVTL